MTITKDHMQTTAATKKKVLLSLGIGVVLLTLALLTFILDPVLIIVRYYCQVYNGSMVHEALAAEIDSIHLSVYLFNITNIDQFLSGEDHKLKVQEVGPFTYQENRTNEDLEIDTENETIQYTPKYKVTFLPEESVGRPEDLQVVMPNLAFLSMASKLSTQNYFLKMGFNMLASQLGSTPTVKMSAYDYMWGYDEPLIRLGNQFLPGWINFAKLGLLDRLYDNKTMYTFKIDTKSSDKFAIKTINGKGGLDAWGYQNPNDRSHCNSFEDVYEGISYPPEMPVSKPLRIYRSILCRFYPLDFQGMKTTDYGVEALHYAVSNKTFQKLPENECLCKNDICLEGVSDMSPCFYGLPVVLSNAHFLDADPSLYKRVEGISPNEEEHGSEFLIEPMMGMVLSTKFSVQVSVLVRDVGFNSAVQRFSDMLVPVVYVKIVQPNLKQDQVYNARLARIHGPYIVMALQGAFILLGLLSLAYSVRVLYGNWIYVRRRGIALHLNTVDIKKQDKIILKPLVNGSSLNGKRSQADSNGHKI